MTQEIEDSLIICSNDPQKSNGDIAKQITTWQMPDTNYRLLQETSKELYDLYFDTPDLLLQTKKISLRIREVCGKRFITAKLPSGLQTDDDMKRSDTEIEREWSQDDLIYVIREIASSDEIKLSGMNQDLDMNQSIHDIMKGIGFEVVQDRYTHREIRNVIWNNNTDSVLTEMAIDSVIYTIKDNKVNHYNVEVEEKKNNGSNARRIIIEYLLLSSYGSFLRKWKYGKLAIGKGVDRLIKARCLREEEYRNLSSVTYDKIEKLITAGII
jgi:hypothetical protein